MGITKGLTLPCRASGRDSLEGAYKEKDFLDEHLAQNGATDSGFRQKASAEHRGTTNSITIGRNQITFLCCLWQELQRSCVTLPRNNNSKTMTPSFLNLLCFSGYRCCPKMTSFIQLKSKDMYKDYPLMFKGKGTSASLFPIIKDIIQLSWRIPVFFC